MLKATTIHQQYEQARKDNIRILIIGAGVAGITAAQMLRRDGQHPVLIERNKDEGHPGYMLALMPMVDQALEDLGVREHYRQNSIPLNRYGFHAHTGRMLRIDSMSSILDRYGDYRGIARGKLIETLTSTGCNVSFNTTVTGLDESSGGTTVTFDSAGETCQLEFDLVIIADGIHSTTRNLVLGGSKVDVVDTKWGGWVVWAPEDIHMDLGEELWGAGFFLGIYPVKGELGVFLGGSRVDTKVGPNAFVEDIRRKLTSTSPRLDSTLKAITSDPEPYYWSLKDCRTPTWAIGRTVLLGDAAAGFLPTAGIGAGMAMESAWVLTRILRHAQRDTVVSLLQAYEKAQRPRVEAAQNTSRRLAGLMFHRSRPLAVLRDVMMRIVSVETAIKPIQKLLANQPNPDHVAKDALKRM
ncbi:2-polyprenyl-6-methoxyphenol hydroxylase-like FAD-dependent oxidoreductase [Bacillus pakistanensis]|uniref:2-polyprenyl-6-methoxyphenol hydroxylase-like FAD-dependent oxidoreductase n=1 Tax=Rossellomorea pakistanensis TaxID=992288 RepID=A0ABS2NJV6_9BACI|nr:NAD(P)/FAD-dependent oxidoreductase [Bacillus pakistanensis]MBM7588138.1 2-polyprenyl-6-methoxyphenol hydroxylase-like FAD-dependent oxidoreductase [Bacillus pakistanensis]